MDTLSYKTISGNKHTDIKKWHVIDANGLVLGRLGTKVASILRGKHKPNYTPHADCGDYVIILNADKVKLTGNKMLDKQYLSYSLYPGGQKSINPKMLLAKKPFAVVEKAVRGMLPKNKLGRALFKKLFVYAGTEHPHTAQQPEVLKLS